MLNLAIGFVVGFVVCWVWSAIKIMKLAYKGKIHLNK